MNRRLSNNRLLVPFLFLSILLTFPAFTSPHPVNAGEAYGWDYLPLPATGETGGWVLAPGSDITAMANTGGRMYSAVNGLAENLFKSDNGGKTWSAAGGVTEPIIDIAVCPQAPDTVFYASANGVYQSSDAGTTFMALPVPGEAGTNNRNITSIAVAWQDGLVIAASIRDDDPGEFGGVYIFDERKGGPVWEDTVMGAYDALDVAFSPGFALDCTVTAIVTDETDTYIFFKHEEQGWNQLAGEVRLNRDNAPATPIYATAAHIVFPAGFLADPCSGEARLFAAVSTGAGGGDVYKVECRPAGTGAMASDLNAGLSMGLQNIDIGCLAVAGEWPDLKLTAGAKSAATVITSQDGGASWQESLKQPPGDSITALGYTGPDRLYAATSGFLSGYAESPNSGETWNQVSFIETEIMTILDFCPSPSFDADGTLFLLTGDAWTYSLWRSRNAGRNWERVLWPGIAGADSFREIKLPPEYGPGCGKVFILGESIGVTSLIESGDGGETYRLRYTRDPETGSPFDVYAWAVAGPETVLVSAYDGFLMQAKVFRTDNGGFFFNNGIPAGDLPLTSLALSPDFKKDGQMMGSNSIGQIYLYDDGRKFRPLPADTALSPFTGKVYPAFDLDYATNHLVYGAGETPGEGIHRFNTVTGTAWIEIDDTAPLFSPFSQLVCGQSSTIYAANGLMGGGLERCLNSRGQDPKFETVTHGLTDTAMLLGLWRSGSHLWSVDAGSRLVHFHDTFCEPVMPRSPADGAGGCGVIIDHAVKDLRLDWEALPGADEYEWQCDDEVAFSDIAAGMQGSTEAKSVRLPALEPGVTYYWRVRTCSPAESPWSSARSFTTSLDLQVIEIQPESPLPGAGNIPANPLFQWTAVQVAEGYELIVAKNGDFTEKVIDRTGDNALPVNVWQCETSLAPGETYYWKVRARTASTFSAWSSAGIFTISAPAEQAPDLTDAQPPEKTDAPAPESVQPLQTVQLAGTIASAGDTTVQPPQTMIVPAISFPEVPGWFLFYSGAAIAAIPISIIGLIVVVIVTRRR